jgi:hypothetical protein
MTMAKLTLTSKALHFLGSFFVGTTESLHMPPDYFTEKGDRDEPSVHEVQQFKVQRDRLTVDAVRRGQVMRVGVLTVFAVLALNMASLFLFGSISAVYHKLSPSNPSTSAGTAVPYTYGAH